MIGYTPTLIITTPTAGKCVRTGTKLTEAVRDIMDVRLSVLWQLCVRIYLRTVQVLLVTSLILSKFVCQV